jgi:hypothetical protein
MVDALQTIDGVGLGRPLAAEPRLAVDILSGKVTGSIKQITNENDFLTTNFIAGSQMRQIAKDQEPFDASNPAEMGGFQKDAQKYLEKAAKDVNMELFGYADLENVKAEPYAASSVA